MIVSLSAPTNQDKEQKFLEPLSGGPHGEVVERVVLTE
jgi:hypothetical protein